MSRAGRNAIGDVAVAAALSASSLPFLARAAAAERDPGLLRLFLLAQELRFCAALVHDSLGRALNAPVVPDSEGYHAAGMAFARAVRAGRRPHRLRLRPGTPIIRLAAGVVYTVTGPSRPRGLLAFSWLGFWGAYHHYRAFTRGVPDGDRRGYARLVLFLPSLVFWPSNVGKEAWMHFSLGLGARGGARLLVKRDLGGFALTAAGTGLAALVRPHVAGMLAGAVASGAAIGRARTPRAAVGALGLAAFAAAAARRLFRREGVATEAGIVSVVRESARRTAKGESRFTPSVVDSPRRLPAAAVTVLFRPWLGEARNPQMLAAAAEGSLLAYLTARRLGDIAAAPRRTRDEPFLAVALVYATLFVVAYSGIANFGVLVRQRVQLLPLLAVLLVGRRRSNG